MVGVEPGTAEVYRGSRGRLDTPTVMEARGIAVGLVALREMVNEGVALLTLALALGVDEAEAETEPEPETGAETELELPGS